MASDDMRSSELYVQQSYSMYYMKKEFQFALRYHKAFATGICLSSFAALFPSNLQFDGGALQAIEITPDKNTGLDKLYVLYRMDGVSVSYHSSSSSPVKWYIFGNTGGAFAVPVEDIVYEGTKSTLKSPKGNAGYIIEDGDKRYYFWLIDYSAYGLVLNSITPSDEQDCDNTIIDIDGKGESINYYTINGRRETLSRDIILEYSTLQWDDETHNFKEIIITKNIPYISEKIYLNPPAYCATIFKLSGDRFLKEWNRDLSLESNRFYPVSVDVMTDAIQENSSDNETPSNQIGSGTDGMGGSAPADISFKAYTTDAVIHNEWQFATDENFENILYRFNEQDLDFTFTEEGNYYVRFIGSNSDGSCESFGETYTISIGSSELKIPNAFSPGDDGINDVWKVSYRSLLDFECRIFDRQGHELFKFNNPDEGWDGKKNGKTVKPGVYFYVIKATGSDGKKYNKSGDINIIKFKGRNNQTGGEN